MSPVLVTTTDPDVMSSIPSFKVPAVSVSSASHGKQAVAGILISSLGRFGVGVRISAWCDRRLR